MLSKKTYTHIHLNTHIYTKKMRRVYLFFSLFFIVNVCAAQITFNAQFLNDSIQIGDINTYRLQVTHPSSVTIRSIDLKPLETDPLSRESFYQDTSFTNDPEKMAQLDEYFQLQGFSREVMELKNYGNWKAPDEASKLSGSELTWTTQNVGDKILKENDIQFRFWEEGIHKILSPVIEYEQNGSRRTITAQDLQFLVGSPIPQETQLDSLQVEPNKTIMEEPFDWVEDFLIPLGFFLLGVLVLVGLIYFVIKQSKKKEEIVLPQREEYIPASNIAMDKLAQLKSEQLWQKDQVKEYQSQLTYIIREYLENRYEIPALENTTFQIGNDLKSLNLNEGLRTEVQNILQVADLVKFAKAEPDANVHEQFMTKAEEFVRATKKSDAEIEAEKEKAELEYQQKLEVAQMKKTTKKQKS